MATVLLHTPLQAAVLAVIELRIAMLGLQPEQSEKVLTQPEYSAQEANGGCIMVWWVDSERKKERLRPWAWVKEGNGPQVNLPPHPTAKRGDSNRLYEPLPGPCRDAALAGTSWLEAV